MEKRQLRQQAQMLLNTIKQNYNHVRSFEYNVKYMSKQLEKGSRLFDSVYTTEELNEVKPYILLESKEHPFISNRLLKIIEEVCKPKEIKDRDILQIIREDCDKLRHDKFIINDGLIPFVTYAIDENDEMINIDGLRHRTEEQIHRLNYFAKQRQQAYMIENSRHVEQSYDALRMFAFYKHIIERTQIIRCI